MTQQLPEWAQNLVPDGADPVDDLTVREFDIVSRKLGVSVEKAISLDIDGKKWAAFAHIAWLWDKRRNPTDADLGRWMDLTPAQLGDALGGPDNDDPDDDQEDEEANPTDSVPA